MPVVRLGDLRLPGVLVTLTMAVASCSPDWSALIAADGDIDHLRVTVAECSGDSVTKVTVLGGEAGSVEDRIVWQINTPASAETTDVRFLEIEIFDVPDGWTELVRNVEKLDSDTSYDIGFLSSSDKEGWVRVANEDLTTLRPGDVVPGVDEVRDLIPRDEYVQNATSRCR